MSDAILTLRHVTKRFPEPISGMKRRMLTAVDDVSFELRPGETLGLLGESGCGKSTLARMILGLIPSDGGEIRYKGADLGAINTRVGRPLRREIQMVFQNPFGCLDPRMRVKGLLMEPLRLWKLGANDEERLARVRQICAECGLSPESLEKRPGEFSGGQLQRIAIARALLLRPRLLVADEIVSALDVSVQNQILRLLTDMRGRYGLSMLFITHDLAVMEKMADRVLVMRRGKIIQAGECGEVLQMPTNPYVSELKSAGFWMK